MIDKGTMSSVVDKNPDLPSLMVVPGWRRESGKKLLLEQLLGQEKSQDLASLASY